MDIKFNLACYFNRCWRSIPGYGEWINQQKRGLNCTLWICSGHRKMIRQFWRSVVSSLIIELSGSTGLHFVCNLTVIRLVTKFRTIYGTWRFNTSYTTSSNAYSIPTQMNPGSTLISFFLKIPFIIILPSIYRLCMSSALFKFTTKILYESFLWILRNEQLNTAGFW